MAARCSGWLLLQLREHAADLKKWEELAKNDQVLVDKILDEWIAADPHFDSSK